MNDPALNDPALNDNEVSLRRPRAALAAVAVAGVAAVAGLLQVIETRRGAGIGFDAAGYIGVARSLMHGHGLRTPVAMIGHHLFTLDPPGYPLLLSTAHWVGLDPADWARWVGLGLAGSIAALSGTLVWRATRSWPAAGAASLAAGCSVDVLSLTTSASSDALALVTVLAFCLAMSWRPRLGWGPVAAAAIFMIFSIATRFAGAATLPAALWVIACTPVSVRDRVRWAGALSVAAAAAVLGVAHGRRHGIGFHASVAVRAVTSIRHAWPIPQVHNNLPVVGAVLGLIIAGVAAAAVLVALLPDRLCPPRLAEAFPTLRSRPARVLAALAVSHLALVFAVTALLQPVIELAVRINIAVAVAAVLLVTMACTDAARRLQPNTRRLSAVPAAAAILGLSLGPAVSQAVNAPNQPSYLGYRTTVWDRQWNELTRLRVVPSTVPIISDNAALVYFRTGRDVIRVPSPIDPDVGIPDPEYAAQTHEILTLLSGHQSLLVAVQPASDSSPTAAPLAAAAHLRLVLRANGITMWANPDFDPALLRRILQPPPTRPRS